MTLGGCSFIFVDSKEGGKNKLPNIEVKAFEKKRIIMKYIFNNCLYFCQEANTVKIFSKNKQLTNIKSATMSMCKLKTKGAHTILAQ